MSVPSSTFPVRERIVEPIAAPTAIDRLRLICIFIACLIINASLIFAFFFEMIFDGRNKEQAAQEISVELAPEPPPAQEVEKPSPEEQQPPARLDEKPADSAPRIASDEGQNQDRRKSSQPKQRSPEQDKADPKTAGAPKVSQPQPSDKPEVAKSAPAKPPDLDRSDAETLENADVKPRENAQKQNQDARLSQRQEKEDAIDEKAANAQQKDDKNDPSAKQSPIGGGDEMTTYSAIIQGLVMKQMKPPRVETAPPGSAQIEFFVNSNGAIMGVRLRRSSGVREIDAAAIKAVRQASPAPHTPYFMPLSFVFTYPSR